MNDGVDEFVDDVRILINIPRTEPALRGPVAEYVRLLAILFAVLSWRT